MSRIPCLTWLVAICSKVVTLSHRREWWFGLHPTWSRRRFGFKPLGLNPSNIPSSQRIPRSPSFGNKRLLPIIHSRRITPLSPIGMVLFAGATTSHTAVVSAIVLADSCCVCSKIKKRQLRRMQTAQYNMVFYSGLEGFTQLAKHLRACADLSV